MQSLLLPSLYSKYSINSLSGGKKTDKLGDVFEELVCLIFGSKKNIKEVFREGYLEKEIIKSFFSKTKIEPKSVSSITATTKVMRRKSGGNSKTDVIVSVILKDGRSIDVPISVKQTTARQVAFAEFSVETICEEVGITNRRAKELMEKHQRDGSARNFYPEEKEELRKLLKPFAEKLVRWTITMSPDEEPVGNEYPKYILKFNLSVVDSVVLGFKFYNIEDYIDYIMYDNKGNIKNGGFGTGLAWTYATGSKGTKIQFKG